jgi:hypothetical protein
MLPKRCLIVLLTLLVATGSAVAESLVGRSFDPPVTVSLTLPDKPPASRRMTVDLVRTTADGLVVRSRQGEQRLTWNEVSPRSAFQAMLRAAPPNDADGWLDLATFGRDIGAEKEAAEATRRAIRADPSVRAKVDRILARPLGTLRGIEQEAEDDEALPEVEVLPGGRQLPPKFLPVDRNDAVYAQDVAYTEAQRAGDQLRWNYRVITTPHFHIFTDWDPIDDRWLREQLEGAYSLLAREFHVEEDDTVFVGRLPVYMFDSADMMLRYAREYDGFDASNYVAGYHMKRHGGFNKLVMSKPSATREMGLPMARRVWSRTLTHEFVHAFLARYRGEGHLPRWLDEGLAEMLAESVMERPGTMELVRHIARTNEDLSHLFDDAQMPTGRYYPVMMSLAQALYRQDPPRFVHMVDRIKSGEPAEIVMFELFGVDNRGLVAAWRRHVLQ